MVVLASSYISRQIIYSKLVHLWHFQPHHLQTAIDEQLDKTSILMATGNLLFCCWVFCPLVLYKLMSLSVRLAGTRAVTGKSFRLRGNPLSIKQTTYSWFELDPSQCDGFNEYPLYRVGLRIMRYINAKSFISQPNPMYLVLIRTVAMWQCRWI